MHAPLLKQVCADKLLLNIVWDLLELANALVTYTLGQVPCLVELSNDPPDRYERKVQNRCDLSWLEYWFSC